MGNFVVTRSFVYANCTHVCRDERHFHSIQSGSLCTHVNGWEFDLNEEEKNYRFNSWKFIWHWRPLNISHFYPHRHDCQLNQNWVNNSSPHQTHPFRFVRGKKFALYKHTEKKIEIFLSYHGRVTLSYWFQQQQRKSFIFLVSSSSLSPSTSVNNKPFQFLSALVDNV